MSKPHMSLLRTVERWTCIMGALGFLSVLRFSGIALGCRNLSLPYRIACLTDGTMDSHPHWFRVSCRRKVAKRGSVGNVNEERVGSAVRFLPCKQRACWIGSRSRVSRQLFSLDAMRRVAAAGPSRHWSCRRTPPPPARLRAATATAIPTATASAVIDAAIPTLPVLPPPPAAHVLDHAGRCQDGSDFCHAVAAAVLGVHFAFSFLQSAG